MNSQPIWIGLIVLGVCALIEYVFPPFPGDAVTVAGAVLIPTAGYPWWGVFLAVMAGSVIGAGTVWALGFWVANTPERNSPFHRLISWGKVAPTIDKIKVKFREHGSAYIALNRFIPAFRSLIFFSAGLAQLPGRAVVIWAAISAALWNAALLALGLVVGFKLDVLTDWVESYAAVVLTIIGLVLLTRWFLAKRRG